MMGLALECALKAVICKTLHISTYPEYTRDKRIDNYFMTHEFVPLLMVSGMTNIFGLGAPGKPAFHWSEFTKMYPGEWTTMRYDTDDIKKKWDADTTDELYSHLNTIFRTINNKKLW